MLNKTLYINGIGSINASPSTTTVSNHHRCVDPDYKKYLDATASRRLGRLIKMALIASKECLKNAEISVPDAIITGTGLAYTRPDGVNVLSLSVLGA